MTDMTEIEKGLHYLQVDRERLEALQNMPPELVGRALFYEGMYANYRIEPGQPKETWPDEAPNFTVLEEEPEQLFTIWPVLKSDLDRLDKKKRNSSKGGRQKAANARKSNEEQGALPQDPAPVNIEPQESYAATTARGLEEYGAEIKKAIREGAQEKAQRLGEELTESEESNGIEF